MVDFLSIVGDIALLAQSACDLVTPTPTPLDCPGCAGSTFSKIGATFGTLGYYAQAGWLISIFDEGMHNWVILAYVCAVIGSLVGFVLGANPKQMFWFMIGPPLFWWLVENRTPVTGMAWKVGIYPRDMREVWQMAETGLINDRFILQKKFKVSSDAAPVSPASEGCDSAACVSDFFAYFDAVVSDTIANIIQIIGANRVILRKESSAGGLNTTILVGDDSVSDTGINPDGILDDYYVGSANQAWDLTSALKWEFFVSITEARLKNGELRQAMASFMASECGEALIESIDQRKMIAAYHNQADLLQTTVLKTRDIITFNSTTNEFGIPFPAVGNIFMLWENLAPYTIPTPRSVQTLLREPAGYPDQDTITENRAGVESLIVGIGKYFMGEETNMSSPGGQTVSIPAPSGSGFQKVDISQQINCRTFLAIILQGLRWESSHIAYQLMNEAPQGVTPAEFAYHMLYGWDLRKGDAGAAGGEPLNLEQARKFIENLVLVHLFRNEMQVAPGQYVEKRFNQGRQLIKNIEDFQRVNNQKAKYGELYVWAKMVPYFQGKIFYILSIIYPFACMLIVIPGMHKAVFQWMQVWLWAKMWDVGFAIVMVLERSIWAITGNAVTNKQLNQVIMQVQLLNQSVVEPNPPLKCAFLPDFIGIPLLNNPTGSGFFSNEDGMGFLLDRLLVLTGNTELDLANVNYI
ncbi:MAG: hypothetical protein KDD53_00890, partial [Bdellovibrionales bacterium]|nr:hypothetical protein [Bdellovibrionales bacterium]